MGVKDFLTKIMESSFTTTDIEVQTALLEKEYFRTVGHLRKHNDWSEFPTAMNIKNMIRTALGLDEGRQLYCSYSYLST